ncbi:ComEC/Rec2 family competence protein [Bradyrhizobium sp. RDM4]|uniref:ComEC/Rec2 family competence protein n=1 Tax=Bradyrhizobium sp. RDM4 TaxID=3378765 RepID=UPI0038FCB00E
MRYSGIGRRLRNQEWSAAAALFAAAFYLLLSGAEVGSFFMTAVLIAVMVDRRTICLRTLGGGSLDRACGRPEALVRPSFQMSFAATLGLVALVQVGMPNLFASPDIRRLRGSRCETGARSRCCSWRSVIAGLSTSRYAAFHFHCVTPFGVLANLGAMPVVSALVMPAGLLGLVAAPFDSTACSGGDRHRLDDRGHAMSGQCQPKRRANPGMS